MENVKERFIIILTILLFNSCYSFLDLDEITSVNYGINIVDTPVLFGEEENVPGALYLKSKHGQQYQCSYLDKSSEERREKEDERAALETGIPELLKPMEEGPCLVHTKGWWSYEFCYGRDIKQYHIENSKISGNVMYLGYYESEFDWNNSTAQMAGRSKRNRLNRYHSQHYVNGSECDLTGQTRKSEVRFQCEEGSGDYIANVDEPESCVYVISVHTTKICHHPYLKPPTPKKPIPITCNPVLTEDEYQYYMTQIQHTAEKKKKLPRQVQAVDESDIDDINGVKVHDSSQQALDKLLTRSHDLLNKMGIAQDENDVQVDMKIKVVKTSEELRKEINNILSSKKGEEVEMKEAEMAGEKMNRAGHVAKGEDVPVVSAAPDDNSHSTSTEELTDHKVTYDETGDDTRGEGAAQKTDPGSTLTNDEDDDEEFIKEFQEGVKKIANTVGEKLQVAKMKQNVQSAMQSQLAEIIQEAQDELGEDIEIDKDVTVAQLAQTLNQLLESLDEKQKGLKTDMKKMNDLLEEDEDEEDEDDEDEDDSAFTTIDLNKKSEKDKKKVVDKSHVSVKTLDKDGTATIDNNVRVRVRRAASEQAVKTGQKKTGALEEKIRKKLEKSGLETGGKRVEVKIITTGYYDNDDDSVHLLSDEESQTFNKMIVTILSGGEDEAKEMDRQNQLEQGYHFKLGKKPQETYDRIISPVPPENTQDTIQHEEDESSP